MTTHDFLTKNLSQLLATTDTSEISTDDVARTLIGHDALDDYNWSTPARGAVDLTRADGEIMRGILHFDAETDEPTGWTTAQGSSADDLQSEDGGTSDDPERVIRELRAAMRDWLDDCDMSDDQIEWLADDLDAEDYYSLSQERDDNGHAYLLVDHENDHSTSITWDRKRDLYVCEEMPPMGGGDEYATADVDEIIAKLNAQAKL